MKLKPSVFSRVWNALWNQPVPKQTEDPETEDDISFESLLKSLQIYYKTILLKDGTQIVCQVYCGADGQPFVLSNKIMIVNPLLLHRVQKTQQCDGETISAPTDTMIFLDWVRYSFRGILFLQLEEIRFCCNPVQFLINNYERYLASMGDYKDALEEGTVPTGNLQAHGIDDDREGEEWKTTPSSDESEDPPANLFGTRFSNN